MASENLPGEPLNWREVKFRSVDCVDKRLLAFIDRIKSFHVNGEIVLKCFRPLLQWEFEEAYRQGYSHIDRLVFDLLSGESVRRLVPELQIASHIDTSLRSVRYGGYELEGALASFLQKDGALVKSPFGDETARSVSREFVDAMLGDNRCEAIALRIDGAWTEWFCDLIWDVTFAVLDPVAKCWWLLCITDTD